MFRKYAANLLQNTRIETHFLRTPLKRCFYDCLKYNTVNNTTCSLSKSLPTLITLITECSNCYDIFWNCVKSAYIRNFFWSVFSFFQSEYGPENTPHFLRCYSCLYYSFNIFFDYFIYVYFEHLVLWIFTSR